ncbi:MAG: DUF58 domain-containing protein [Muribaculaceae bacterium]|nr:DUF58 domain-containing protein [Muribaculaceae bacterium]MBR3100459.1 DUF58 domain-containing protein [Muribaculaceae bacterium]
MEQNELLKKVRKIEIKTKGLSQDIFAGEYHSAFKGRGMTFSEVREYQYGDDVRDIDWNVTARYNRPYVKVYEEERELTVMLMVDVSGSKDFGAVGQAKREMMAEIAATLAFSAIQNNDKVGVIFFSDKIEKFIPPKKGRKHILLVIRELLNFEPTSGGTDVNQALEYMTSALKKRCTTFLVSDFIDTHDYYKSLSIANHKHDVIAIQVYDKREANMPNVGLLRVRDAERGTERWVDTSSRRVRQAYDKWWYERQQQMTETVQRCQVDLVSVATDEDYVKALMGLFKKRG